MSESAKHLILGPQRPEIYLGQAMRDYALDEQPIAVISAGWQAAEGDIDDIRDNVGLPMTDLGLYAQSASLFAADPELHNAYRERQDRLTEQQRVYRLRLKHLKIALRQTLRAEGPAALVAPERRHAVSQLRALDRHHQRQIDNIHTRFNAEYNLSTSSALAEHTQELEERLAPIKTLIVTGGHLMVLLNRLRLFGIPALFTEKNIVAWSAGAMLLGQQIVLFHDRLPQGRRDVEIIDRGCGSLQKVVIMPDARNRLRTGNTLRMSALSRRFSPATCLLLNNGSAALFANGKLVKRQAVSYPTRGGRVKKVAVK